jgi:hypothetical protein
VQQQHLEFAGWRYVNFVFNGYLYPRRTPMLFVSLLDLGGRAYLHISSGVLSDVTHAHSDSIYCADAQIL